jgi:hypothetical protein
MPKSKKLKNLPSRTTNLQSLAVREVSVLESAKGKHARLAPSAFKGYEICPSYLPNEEVTKAGERGTALHEIMRHKKVPAEVLPDEDAAQLFLISEYIQPFEQAAVQAKNKILREHGFDLSKWKIEGCDRGTGDLLILDKPKARVDLFDYKFGAWEVDDAEVNIQLAIYTLGVFAEFTWADEVGVHVLQPARDEVSTTTFTRKDIPPILLRAKTIADRVNAQAGKVFNPSIDACLWCDNKANCHALHSLVLSINDAAQLELPFIDLRPENFNDLKNAGLVYDVANVIEKWASAIKWSITQLAEDGQIVPDHVIRVVSGKRYLVDVEGTYEILHTKFQLSLSEFFIASNPSVGKLMSAVSQKAPHGEKEKRAKLASKALEKEGVLALTKPSAYLVRSEKKKKEPIDK